jgi:protein-S-isoprenylcysteine O-methyltransferase Ste14
MYFSVFLQVVIVVVLFIGVIRAGTLSITGIRELLIKEKPSDHIRTDGLQKYMRHPIYSLGLVFMWLFPVMTVNLISLWVAISIYILIGASLEERKLLVDFPEYKDYQKRAPMFVPKIHPPG